MSDLDNNKSPLGKKTKLDIFITITATTISVIFIIASYIFNNHSTQILSILIIVLPTIYIIGNLIIREIMEKEYNDGLIEVTEGIEEMKIEIDKLKDENKKLKSKLKKNKL